MREEEVETAIKVVVVGNGAVGKSSMIQRYCKGIFTRDYKKTIGVDFLERMIDVEGEEVRLMLWDTAGQEEFDAITKAYYRGAQACVLAFSSTDMDSFYAIPKWKKKVEDEVGEVNMVIVQNKIDLIDLCSIDENEISDLASSLGLPLYKTSVKENIRVDDVFIHLAVKYMNQVDEIVEEQKPLAIGDPELLNKSTNSSQNHCFRKNHKKKMRWLRRSSSKNDTITLKVEPSKRRTSGKIVPKCQIL